MPNIPKKLDNSTLEESLFVTFMLFFCKKKPLRICDNFFQHGFDLPPLFLNNLKKKLQIWPGMASLSSLFWYAHKNLEDQMILFRFCLSIISSTLINFVKLHFLDPACVHGHSGSGNAYADFLSRASYSPRGSASTRGAP